MWIHRACAGLCLVSAGCAGGPFTGELDEAADPADAGDAGLAATARASADGGADAVTPADPLSDAGADAIPVDADAGACDGGPLYLHHVGLLGLTWQDCVPTGTYDSTEALQACWAYEAATDAGVPAPGLPLCFLMESNSVCVGNAALDGFQNTYWTYTASAVSAVGHVAAQASGGACTSTADPSWD